MEQKSQNYISFIEALEASREIYKYYTYGEYVNDMKALREDPKVVEEFLSFYEAICKA